MPATADIAAALAPLALPEHEAQLLAVVSRCRTLPAGAALTHLASARRTLTVLLSGTAVATRVDGSEYPLSAESAPVIIGELTVLRRCLTQTADVRTTSECVVLTVPGVVYDRLADRLPTLTSRLRAAAAERLAAAEAADAPRMAQRREALKAYREALERVAQR